MTNELHNTNVTGADSSTEPATIPPQIKKLIVDLRGLQDWEKYTIHPNFFVARDILNSGPWLDKFPLGVIICMHRAELYNEDSYFDEDGLLNRRSFVEDLAAAAEWELSGWNEELNRLDRGCLYSTGEREEVRAKMTGGRDVTGTDGGTGGESSGDLTTHNTGNTDSDDSSPRVERANRRQVGGAHYQDEAVGCPSCGRAIQHWDIATQLGWCYLIGAATKYIWRHKRKNGIEDIKKAIHYLEKYVESVELECSE